ncbi:MAG: rRNA pseudouridine synthase [Deltaproteobacteria bacterium]|nr:rRNA pseudouridine synthase [Deltaproteobacteria bacterium]
MGQTKQAVRKKRRKTAPMTMTMDRELTTIQPEPIPEEISKKYHRINRILSMAGLASRRKADELIRSGRIMLNNRIITELGTRAAWGRDIISLDGKEIPSTYSRIYLIMNKPFGYISSLKDPEGRPVVTDILKELSQRVYPVGRLDFDSIGLLLLTNDGEFSYRLTHPRYRVPKTYKVIVSGNVSDEVLTRLQKGILLDDGFSGVSKSILVEQSGKRSTIRLTITQGRSRLVRRMMEAVGLQTVHLIRTGFGNLELGNLKIGDYRSLKPGEVQGLKKMVGLA